MENTDEVIYFLTIEDVQNVAEQELDRELSAKEIALIEERVAENIPWYDAIAEAINELIVD